MTAEPPSRQDLQQKPTIIVEPTQIINSSEDDERKMEKKHEKKSKEDTLLETSNQDLDSPSQSHALLKDKNLQASNQSLSSTEHDTYL